MVTLAGQEDPGKPGSDSEVDVSFMVALSDLFSNTWPLIVSHLLLNFLHVDPSPHLFFVIVFLSLYMLYAAHGFMLLYPSHICFPIFIKMIALR